MKRTNCGDFVSRALFDAYVRELVLLDVEVSDPGATRERKGFSVT